MLFEATEADWWAGVDGHDRHGHPGYREFVEWTRGRCYSGFDVAMAAYTEHLASLN